MTGECCVCLGGKEIWVFGSFRPFFKIFDIYLRTFENLSKWNKISDFFAFKAYTTLSHHFDPILVIFGLRLTLNHNKNVPNHNKHNQILWFMLILIWLTLILIWLTLILIWLKLILIWLTLILIWLTLILIWLTLILIWLTLFWFGSRLFWFGSRYSDLAHTILIWLKICYILTLKFKIQNFFFFLFNFQSCGFGICGFFPV